MTDQTFSQKSLQAWKKPLLRWDSPNLLNMSWIPKDPVTHKTADISETIYHLDILDSTQVHRYTHKDRFFCFFYTSKCKKINKGVFWTTQSLHHGSKWTQTFFSLKSIGPSGPMMYGLCSPKQSTRSLYFSQRPCFFLFLKYGSKITPDAETM